MAERIFSEEEVLALAKNAYENGSAGFEIKTSDCALLVIDMQDEFVKPHWTPYWVPEATKQVPLINELIVQCKNKNIPVIYTVMSKTYKYYDRPASGKFMPNRYPDAGVDQPGYFIEGKIFNDILIEENDIVIHKPSYGAFYDTPLETILRNLKKDTVIICGTLTNFCCGTTARQAYERSFKVIFGSDVTSTDDMSMQDTELNVLRKGYARIMTSDEIIGMLT